MSLEQFDNIKNYTPIRENIIFSFIQDIASGTFTNKTEWGLEVRNKMEDIKTPRWGRVDRVGPDVPKRIKEGTYILVEQLMWTENIKVGDDKKWSTNAKKLLASSDIEPKGIF